MMMVPFYLTEMIEFFGKFRGSAQKYFSFASRPTAGKQTCSYSFHIIPITLYVLHFHTHICVCFTTRYHSQQEITNYTLFTSKNLYFLFHTKSQAS